jgi:hypothetical protein
MVKKTRWYAAGRSINWGMAVGEKLSLISRAWKMGVGLAVLHGVVSCQSLDQQKEGDKKDDASAKTDAGSNVDVSFLLSMTFEEAKRMGAHSEEMPPYFKIVGDEVTVLARNSMNFPKRIRAKGRVFLEVDFREKLISLCQEALISPEEVILRGKPLLKRGRTVVEGLDDTTVFYVRGVDLHVIGKHRITTEKGVTPTWKHSWKEGPNPLLPALTPADVPKEIRASPLLPPPPGMVQPSVGNPSRPVGEAARETTDIPLRRLGEPPKREQE